MARRTRGRAACPCRYFHVVFTLPARIAAIAYQNKAVVYDLLFRAAAETVLTIAADPKHLGARIGITAVLHTWGSTMTHHPHVHMIVPGGGISLDGSRWVSVPAPLLPACTGILQPVPWADAWRSSLAAHKAGQLKFFGQHAHLAERKAFAAYLAPLRKRKWYRLLQSPRSADQRRCSPICRAIPTASPSPTAGCLRSTTTASPSSTRTIAPTAARDARS